jgi:hypothetical protein
MRRVRKEDILFMEGVGVFLLNWGFEIIAAIITAGTVAWAKIKSNNLLKQKEKAEENARILAEQKLEADMDIKLEPIYEELEDLRAYIREAASIEKSHMALIIASYRFRLI